MPEVWLPYLDVSISFKLSSSQLGEVIEPATAVAPPQAIEAEAYIGDWSSITKSIAASMGLKQLKLSDSGFKESVIDGELIKFPAGIERAIMICSVRVDPAFGFTGPHWLFAKAIGPEDAFLKRSEQEWRLGEELGWFSKRVLEESGAKALCYFGNGSRAIFGRADEALGKIEEAMVKVKPSRERQLVIASAGGVPYDETFNESLYGLYQALVLTSEGGTLVYLAGSRSGLGDDRTLERISGKGQASPLLDSVLGLAHKKGISVYMVSGLPFYYLNALGFVPFTTAQSAVDKAIREGQKATVIKEASTIFIEKR